jgi:TatA/E family protein of Tat protein translocase
MLEEEFSVIMPNFSGFDLLILFVVALLVFGPKRLPEMGAAIGRSIREFKKGLHELTSSEEENNHAYRTPESASEKSPAQGMPATGNTRGTASEKT